jgi:hypothetical protein
MYSALLLVLLMGSGLAVHAAEADKRDPREILDICRSAPELEADPRRGYRFGDAEPFSSSQGEWCCYPFYRGGTFMAWVTEFKVNEKNGRVTVRRCIEDTRQKANPWAKAGYENSFQEDLIQSTGTATVGFRKIE